MSDSENIKKPRPFKMISEMRAMIDIGSTAATLLKNTLKSKAISKGRNIILLPGFSSDDRYLVPLKMHLQKLGYHAEGWGLGFNMAGTNLNASFEDLTTDWGNLGDKENNGEAGVPYLCDLATEKIKYRAISLESKVTLIGWSLGGYIAREVARELPDLVDQVITMGAPIIGGPKYTSAAPFFEKRGQDLDWVEKHIALRDEMRPIQQSITVIYSKSDGIVSWKAAIDHKSPNVEHIEVNAAHLGMGFNQKIWKIIETSLTKDSS